MDRHVGRRLARHGERAHVAHDHGIHARGLQHGEITMQVVDILVGHHGVHGDVHIHAVRMGVLDHAGQLVFGEIIGATAHAVARRGQIHRIGAEVDRVFELLPAARRREQLHRCKGRRRGRHGIPIEKNALRRAGVRYFGRSV